MKTRIGMFAAVLAFAAVFGGCMAFYPLQLTVVDVGQGKVIQKGGFPITFGGIRCINNTGVAIDFRQAGRWGDEFYANDVPPGGSWFFYWDYTQYPQMSITAQVRGSYQSVSQVFTGNSYNPPTRIWTVHLSQGRLWASTQ
ncbi:hypothetical protein M1413_01055 [Patescibacteria group bacterium]|nr:hypothetical protein [Patescibacteria group bacterium]MCL5114342.1 hypothetical protein [Patescibacteria group bacterium]